MKKKCNVVMLASQKASPIIKQLDASNHLISKPSYPWELTHNWQYQHLYTLSDDEIKEGDWVHTEYHKPHIFQVKEIKKATNSESLVLVNDDYINYKSYCKKIIATTNPELWWDETKLGIIDDKSHILIPKISLDFVEAYIRTYNKGDKIQIKEVMVEYIISKSMNKSEFPDIPKVASNGTINITPIEERKYTLQEVSDLVHSEYGNYLDYLLDNDRCSTEGERGYLSFKDWFNKNY